MPVGTKDQDIPLTKYAVTAEAFSIAGAIGASFTIRLLTAPITDSNYIDIGDIDDSSLVVATGNALTNEVAWVRGSTYAAQIALMDNGDYAVDYTKGIIIGKKATITTSHTFNYKAWAMNVNTEIEVTGVVITNIKVYSPDGTAINSVYAKCDANDLPYARISDGTSDVTIETGTKKALDVNITDGTNDLPTMDANTRPGFVTVTDGTSEVDIIGTINSLKSDLSSVAGIVTNVNGGNRDTGTQTVTLADNDPAIISLALIDDTVYTLGTDTYTEASSKGLLIGVVRNDAGDSLVDTDGEITSLQVNAYGMLNTNLDMIRDVAPDVGAGNVSAGCQRFVLATNDINTAAMNASLAIMDDWDATEDTAIGVDGSVEMNKARSSQITAVDNDDAVIPVTNLYGEKVNAGYTWATESNRSEEINPISQQYVSETLIDETNITTNTTTYAYMDLNGFKTFSIQGETSGTAPTDVLTVTIEGTLQDDGTAAASCAYQDITTVITNPSVASWVDVDFMLLVDTPMAFKYIRVKYVTSNGGGGDCDLTIYTKKLY